MPRGLSLSNAYDVIAHQLFLTSYHFLDVTLTCFSYTVSVNLFEEHGLITQF